MFDRAISVDPLTFSCTHTFHLHVDLIFLLLLKVEPDLLKERLSDHLGDREKSNSLHCGSVMNIPSKYISFIYFTSSNKNTS